MCKKKTEEQREERRKKRSAFLSRMVDEFKKIILIVTFPFVFGFLAWAFVLYRDGVALPYAIPVALITGFFSSVFAYCVASYKEKVSLNQSGLTKGVDGAVKKIASTIETVVTNVAGKTTTTVETEDSDEKEEE
ncbi:MAG: hypothetical protein ABFC31_07095 [Clostridiaceae bacterium]